MQKRIIYICIVVIFFDFIEDIVSNADQLNSFYIIIIIINLTLWRTLQNVIQTQKCVPNQKNQLWTSVFSSV